MTANPFAVKCRSCGAPAGVQCTNGVTGRPLRRALAHPCRLHDTERSEAEESTE